MRKILVIAALARILPTEARAEGVPEGSIPWYVSGGGGNRLSDDATGRLGTIAAGAGLPTGTATTVDLAVRATFGKTENKHILLGEFFGGIGASILPVHSRGYVRGILGPSMVEEFVNHGEEEVPEEDVLERRLGAGLMLQAGFVVLPFSREGVGKGGITLGVTVTPTYYLDVEYEPAGDWRGSLLVEAGVVSW